MALISYTIATNYFLPQACVLGKSFLEYNPDYDFFIALLDSEDEFNTEYLTKHNIKYVPIEKMKISYFDEMRARYNAFEMSCAMKPFVAEYFIKQGFTKLIYLDSDILVLSSFDIKIFDNNSAFYLTPHSNTPVERNDNNKVDLGYINHGIYNAGFIACNSSAQSLKILKWWSNKLRFDCVVDIANGKYVDQTWLNLIPIYFNDVSILKNDELNVAPWNLYERNIYYDGTSYLINKNPLVFYHFSGFDFKVPNLLSRHHEYFDFINKSELLPLYSNYVKLINQINQPDTLINYYQHSTQDILVTLMPAEKSLKNRISNIFKWIIQKIKY
jgi:hypothetical protein